MKDIIGRHLSHIKIKNHPVLKDIDLDLINPKTNKPYDIVAFVGENGCGKTTMLNELFNYDKSEFIVDKEYMDRPHRALFLRQGSVHSNALKEVRKLIDGKDMYPNSSYRDPLFDSRLWNNERILKIIDELGDEQVHRLVADNHLDDITCSGVVSQLIDGKEHGYNITSFSSGQQEVLLKLKDIQDLSYDDFMLLDEPETSLHPRWQRQIINLIREMVNEEHGQVPQIFLATHSEKVLESLIENENALIVRLFRQDGTITTESISQMSLVLPKVTFAELDYVVFHIPSLDYHDQLFTHFGAFFDKDTSTAIDLKIERKAQRMLGKENIDKYKKERVNARFNKIYKTSMLPTYIRDFFHHPNDIEPPTNQELVLSIEFLRSLIEYMNMKGIKEIEE